MAVFSDPSFVACVAVLFVLGQLRGPVRRTTWFGLLNALAILALFGWKALLFLLVVSALCWAGLRLVSSPIAPRRVRRVMPWLLYGGIVALFVLHKMALEPSNDFTSWYPLSAVTEAITKTWIAPGFTLLQILAFSYVTLRLIDVVRAGLAGEPLLNPLALSGFLVPFFMSPSGPVNEYETHLTMDEVPPPEPTAAHFVDSVFTIVFGYFLKFVVAQAYGLFFVGLHGTWPTGTLLETANFLFFVLIEFSGYSLIALGIGRLLGIPTPINFNHPYLSITFTEFWTRWHMSLGAFVKRTFYFPVRIALTRWLKPARTDKLKIHLINSASLLLPFAFVGIWHRFTWAFLLWGLVLGSLVAIETVVREEFLSRLKVEIPAWISMPMGIAYTITLVVITLQIASRDFAK